MNKTFLEYVEHADALRGVMDKHGVAFEKTVSADGGKTYHGFRFDEPLKLLGGKLGEDLCDAGYNPQVIRHIPTQLIFRLNDEETMVIRPHGIDESLEEFARGKAING